MKTFFHLIVLWLAHTYSAEAAITERRIWIENAGESIAEDLCRDKVKTWRCIFQEHAACIKAIKGSYSACAHDSLPDLPEYIDGSDTKEQATKVIVDCITADLKKKHIQNMSNEASEDYNVCTGASAPTKPLNPNIQKSLEFSKTQTVHSCAVEGFLRKCFSLSESECKERLESQQQQCAVRMEAEGTVVRSDPAFIQEAGRKITDCTTQETRKLLDATRNRSKTKDCE